MGGIGCAFEGSEGTLVVNYSKHELWVKGKLVENFTRPAQTILVLISDLIEGGVAEQLLRRTAKIVGSGATMVCLLALSDDGAPCFDERLAAQMSALGAPAFACTPDRFSDLMATAIQKRDIGVWAARNEIVVRV